MCIRDSLTAIGGITADDRVECWYGAASWSAGLSDFNELFKLDTVADFDDTTETSYVAAVQTDGKLADCTVTFDSNGGTDVDAQTVKAGKQVTKPADLTKENRTFAGWYLKKQNGGVATTPFDFSQPVTGDITLIAKWNRTVTYWFYKDKVVVNTCLLYTSGGRHTPFFNNYRPQFYFRTTDVTGVINLPEGVEMCMPGDNVEMTVELITHVAMSKGLRFAIREGGRTVGAGSVVEIIE